MIRRAGALPKEPTAAPPGSEEKIRVMTERAARREQLFHPLDGPGYRGGPPTPPEEPAEWPFDLVAAPEFLGLDGLEDFDEDEEGIGIPEAPAFCSWTEPVPTAPAEPQTANDDPLSPPAGNAEAELANKIWQIQIAAGSAGPG